MVNNCLGCQTSEELEEGKLCRHFNKISITIELDHFIMCGVLYRTKRNVSVFKFPFQIRLVRMRLQSLLLYIIHDVYMYVGSMTPCDT